METHGFADLCAWEVDSVGPDGVTLALESTPLTKFLYPFDFTLLLNYNLEAVSYTHLDVYKRQVWATGWTCPGRVGSTRKRRGSWAYR